jgi:hypothetical protein
VQVAPAPRAAGTDGEPVAAATTGDDDVLVAERDDDPAPWPVAAPRAVQAAVHPVVQPAAYSAAAVQPDPYTPMYDATRAALPSAATTDAPPPPADPDETVEHPGGLVEHLPSAPAEPAPRERARAAALRHAHRRGVLPTVSELEALAAVSRGTAAAALKALREHPSPLHLVPDPPDRETQP